MIMMMVHRWHLITPGIWEKFDNFKPERRIPGPVGTLIMSGKPDQAEYVKKFLIFPYIIICSLC